MHAVRLRVIHDPKEIAIQYHGLTSLLVMCVDYIRKINLKPDYEFALILENLPRLPNIEKKLRSRIG